MFNDTLKKQLNTLNLTGVVKDKQEFGSRTDDASSVEKKEGEEVKITKPQTTKELLARMRSDLNRRRRAVMEKDKVTTRGEGVAEIAFLMRDKIEIQARLEDFKKSERDPEFHIFNLGDQISALDKEVKSLDAQIKEIVHTMIQDGLAIREDEVWHEAIRLKNLRASLEFIVPAIENETSHDVSRWYSLMDGIIKKAAGVDIRLLVPAEKHEPNSFSWHTPTGEVEWYKLNPTLVFDPELQYYYEFITAHVKKVADLEKSVLERRRENAAKSGFLVESYVEVKGKPYVTLALRNKKQGAGKFWLPIVGRTGDALVEFQSGDNGVTVKFIGANNVDLAYELYHENGTWATYEVVSKGDFRRMKNELLRDSILRFIEEGYELMKRLKAEREQRQKIREERQRFVNWRNLSDPSHGGKLEPIMMSQLAAGKAGGCPFDVPEWGRENPGRARFMLVGDGNKNYTSSFPSGTDERKELELMMLPVPGTWRSVEDFKKPVFGVLFKKNGPFEARWRLERFAENTFGASNWIALGDLAPDVLASSGDEHYLVAAGSVEGEGYLAYALKVHGDGSVEVVNSMTDNAARILREVFHVHRAKPYQNLPRRFKGFLRSVYKRRNAITREDDFPYFLRETERATEEQQQAGVSTEQVSSEQDTVTQVGVESGVESRTEIVTEDVEGKESD